ncbi:MAG: toprim domain-containing protein [Rhodobacteraceae bacterium]|nr:toprim domain-containing protein [Paracoccaceae bacterium]
MKDAHLNETILARLKPDYGFKDRGDWLQEGKCPACGKRELFTRTTSPWVLRCGRQNKCGAEFGIRELYPDLFEDFNKRYRPSADRPNATADAYMELARGLDPARMVGWYRQEKFWHPHAVGDKGSATVRFDIDRENDIYMERLVEPVDIKAADGTVSQRKAHFNGSYRGLWWIPPGMEIEDGDEVWLVEGCIDAASLYLNGVKAVATLTCTNYPSKPLMEYQLRPIKWVWALDNDKAGRRYNRKHARTMRDAGFGDVYCALIPQKGRTKTDYNDAHKAGRLTPRNIAEYKYQGALLLAANALDKALLIWNQKNINGFDFEYDKRLYWFELDIEKYAKAVEALKETDEGHAMDQDEIKAKAAQQSGSLVEMANCYPEFLYFQVNELTDESWYYSRIHFPHGARPVKNTFTGAQLSAPTEFKKRMLSVAAGSIFTGSRTQLDRFLKKQLFGIKTVDTIDFIGYSKEHGAYVFNDIAVADGAVTRLNDEDFFEVGKTSIKSLNQSVHLHIGQAGDYSDEWVQLVWECFGAKGMIAVAFWFGSLFAEQIRGIQKSYPFLEVVGEPGAGKSTLIEFLWKLVGRQDYEGFDPSKSTLAARSRNFAQVSNLPVVLIEADRDEDTAKARRFDWDELKTAYNGRASRARGVKTSGNETYEPPFRGAIVISQNADVNASEAILQRIIHLNFDKSAHTPGTKDAAEKLESMPLASVSHFLERACRAEKAVMETVKSRTRKYEQQLMKLDGLKSVRIAKNHGQLLALVDALGELVSLTDMQMEEIYQTVCDLALERQDTIIADHPIVREFWETYDFLNGGGEGSQVLNHSRNDREIAINLNHFVRIATYQKQQIPLLTDLKRHLKTSKSRKFKDIKTVKTALQDQYGFQDGRTVKCWVFEHGI